MSFIYFVIRLHGAPDSVWRVGLLPLAFWVVLVVSLRLPRVILFLKWRVTWQTTFPISHPHKDSVRHETRRSATIVSSTLAAVARSSGVGA